MDKEEQIDKYLKGELTEKERKDFEHKIGEDSELAEEFNFQQSMVEGVKDVFRDEMLMHFDDLEKQIAKSPKTVQKSKGKIRRLVIGVISLAASVLLIIFVWITNKPNTEQLFADNYTTYPNYVSNVERSNPTVKDLYATAFQQYEKGEYTKAIQDFEAILAIDKEDSIVEFYLGLAYLENKDAAQALEYLNASKQASAHRFVDPALWYAALAELQLGQTEAAKTDLEVLMNKEGSYQQKAQELFKQL